MFRARNTLTLRDEAQRTSVAGRLSGMPWFLVMLIIVLACVGFTALYSAAGGNLEPWALQQMIRFLPGLAMLLFVAMTDIKWIYLVAYPFWVICVILLIIVEVAGVIGMGAQRWLDLGVINLQPSDLAKVGVVMALARYYHAIGFERAKKLKSLAVPAFIVLIPVGLIVLQPDLGTAIMIVMIGAAMVFLAGAPWWLFAGGIGAVAGLVPVIYTLLHDYQKKRVLTFLNPESDPLGAGYHITQSKIAIGSGGFSGKGFLEGSQAHLNFLPEKHTDFVFTLLAEEWGFLGGVVLLVLFALIFYQGYAIAFRARNTFGRLLALGLITNYAIYIVINIGMVTGLMPVVGEPLPLISYGGTAMISNLFAFGLIMAVAVNRHSTLPRS